jgi:hypothetical protein
MGKSKIPLVMAKPPTVDVIINDVVIDAGTEVLKVKVEPPSFVFTLNDGKSDDDAEKSPRRPVVASMSSETEMVQTIPRLIRAGLAFVHANWEAVVGLPYTKKDCEPKEMGIEFRTTETEKAVVATRGVAWNNKVAPKSGVDGIMFDALDETMMKSIKYPAVRCESSETVIWQLIGASAR